MDTKKITVYAAQPKCIHLYIGAQNRKRISNEKFSPILAAVCIAFIYTAYADTPGYTVAVPPKYTSAYNFSEGLAAVRLDGKRGFISIP
jgi:hypothetical protein